MKDKIIHKASELFLTLGFKSVTMDDIAQELGISKKTIYVHFPNKTKLVEETTLHMFETISCGIDGICAQKKNPIEEVFEIKQLVMEHLKNEKSSPQYQLQKYYPKIYSTLKKKQYQVMQTCVIDNLNRGIELGLYRADINTEFVSKIYFTGMVALKDKELFPLHNYSMQTLMNFYLEYHLRGICTSKGINQMDQFIKSHQSKTP